MGRSVDRLRIRFSTFHQKRIPTGDLLIPDEVRRLKHIRNFMTERADIGVADETDDVVGTLLPDVQ